MNVTQLAKHLGISKPTLYKRVKDAGLQLDDLRNTQTGELTQHGVESISALFDDNVQPRKDVKPTPHNAEMLVLRGQVEAAQRENDLLREMLAAKDAELQRMTAEVQRMAVDLEAWRTKAQEIDVQQLLLATAAAPRRRGLLDAIKDAFRRGDRDS